MRVYFVVLVAVATFLSSSSALSTTADSSPIKEAIRVVAPHTSRTDQRFLRSYEEKEDVDSEDRDMAGVIKAVKAMSSRTKWRAYVDDKKLERIRKYFDKDVPYETLYKKKVKQFDVFRALNIPGRAETSKEREWWVGYYNFWVDMKAKNVKGG